MANHLYIGILKNGPFTPVVRVEETTDGDMVIPAHYAPKDPSEYTEPEREKVSLDSALQLILIESLDNYEGFMAKPKEGITDVFERFNKLINDLQLHDKFYDVEEVNLKFLLTLPDHLEQKISAIREGRDLSRITLEVLYGVLKTYELEMIQKKSLRAGQGYVMDGSSALIVNDGQTSNDEQRSPTPAISTSEKRVNDTEEQVILELDEEDEFYTLDELDELDKSMAYLARKFSNIRVKKPRFFKSKGQFFNKDSSWKGKGKYTPDSKTGYKTGSVDRSKIRCFNCDELGHFATECRKPKKAKKDKAYLELEAMYDALLKKQQGKAYIAEGKCWDDSDNDEDEEVGNYALMALEQGDSSSSKSQLPTLTIIDLNVELDAAKQEIAYLKNKLKCAIEIEAVLRERLEKNEVNLKSFKNASELIGQYHGKNKPCANIAIGLDYEGLNNKKKFVSDKEKSTEAENVPIMLKKVESPLFKACEVNFSEEELIIKQEIADEDKQKKNNESTQSSIPVETPKANQETKELVKEIKAEEVKKKKKNRNGKIGINKSNNFAYVADAPRKRCEKYGTMNHLTHLCKKGKGKKVIWIIDSGCSRHMIGDKALLSQFGEMAGPLVTFGDNNK
ncbi:hypothetical protein AgCh_012163 [Apium graveolens]